MIAKIKGKKDSRNNALTLAMSKKGYDHTAKVTFGPKKIKKFRVKMHSYILYKQTSTLILVGI